MNVEFIRVPRLEKENNILYGTMLVSKKTYTVKKSRLKQLEILGTARTNEFQYW